MIHIRRAGALDAGPMAELLNEIIARGGTTAHTQLASRDTIIDWMTRFGENVAWHVAEDDHGKLMGFQFVEPHTDLPPEAGDVATFVRVGQTGLGVGSKLFDATCIAARALGFRWINATIRADNEGGLAYYQSRGFENYARDNAVVLGDGTITDKISKRFDL